MRPRTRDYAKALDALNKVLAAGDIKDVKASRYLQFRALQLSALVADAKPEEAPRRK